jgi:hypothetical protein
MLKLFPFLVLYWMSALVILSNITAFFLLKQFLTLQLQQRTATICLMTLQALNFPLP